MKNNFGILDEIRTVGEAVLAVFIPFKLTGIITWSWFWVLSPFWIIPLANFILLFIVWVWSLIVNYGKK